MSAAALIAGYGSGYGYGDGSGYGYGYGSGYGSGYGDGYGYGSGYGDGDGYGSGDGSGYGYGYGSGDGYGDGSGYGRAIADISGNPALLVWPGWVRVGCQLRSIPDWRENWEAVASQHGLSVTAEQVNEWLRIAEGG